MRPGVRHRPAPPRQGELIPADEPPAARALREAHEAAGVKPRRASGSRPFKLTTPKAKERPQQGAITRHLNQAVIQGLAVHVVNEGLWSFIDIAVPDPKQRGKLIGQLKNAMLNDGFMEGFPDELLFWPLPDRWRAILEAAGEKVPELMAFAGTMEIKKPGWTESGDKKFREGHQPKAHARLRMSGVPCFVVRDEFEANAAAVAMGAPLRIRLNKGAGGGIVRSSGDDDPPT